MDIGVPQNAENFTILGTILCFMEIICPIYVAPDTGKLWHNMGVSFAVKYIIVEGAKYAFDTDVESMYFESISTQNFA
jgi:hypothetical protein